MAFRTTRWSLVLAVQGAGDGKRRALDELCAVYWPPVLAYYRAQTRSADDAADLAQGLFADLIERRDLEAVDASRGKFRTFLLTAARNFHLKDLQRQRTQKRGGGAATISIGDPTVLGNWQEPAVGTTPDAAFERQWARSVIEAARRALAADYEQRGQAELFTALEPCLQGEDHTPYAEIAAQRNMRVGAVKVAVHRLRQRFREQLLTEVRQTLGEGEDAVSELRALLGALAAR